jgi:hypothetical protein
MPEYSELFGAFVFYKNIQLFSSWAQRYWTYSEYSHMSSIVGTTSLKTDLEFDADLLVRLHTFKRNKNMDIIKWSDEVPNELIERVLKEVIKEYEGRIYGFISWLTIFIRFGLQRLGCKSMHKRKIFVGIGWGVTCSELMHPIFQRILTGMATISPLVKWKNFLNKINEYNPDTFVPQDAWDLKLQFSGCFQDV